MIQQSGAMYLDSSEFDIKFAKYMDKDSIEDARKGLGKAGEAFMKDIADEEPKAPVLTSALVSSMSVFVGKMLVATSLKFRRVGVAVKDFIVRKHTEPIPPDTEQAMLVVNAPYATYQHETYHKGYVFAKMAQFGKKYFEIVAATMRKRTT